MSKIILASEKPSQTKSLIISKQKQQNIHLIEYNQKKKKQNQKAKFSFVFREIVLDFIENSTGTGCDNEINEEKRTFSTQYNSKQHHPNIILYGGSFSTQWLQKCFL